MMEEHPSVNAGATPVDAPQAESAQSLRARLDAAQADLTALREALTTIPRHSVYADGSCDGDGPRCSVESHEDKKGEWVRWTDLVALTPGGTAP